MQAKIRATGTQPTIGLLPLGFAIAGQPRRLSLMTPLVIPSKRSAARNLLSTQPSNVSHFSNADQ